MSDSAALLPLRERLAAEAAHEGITLARRALGAGLAVTGEKKERHAIPLSATPVILDADDIRRRGELARSLGSASVKLAQAAVEEGRSTLLAALSPLELAMARRQRGKPLRLACVRVDSLVADARPWALEVNATIPAMQGYSDMAAEALISVLGERARLPPIEIARLQRENGSNARALHRALVDGYRAVTGHALPPRRIALLCRRGDSQLTELQFLAQRFSAEGTPASVVHPDALHFGDKVYAGDTPVDLVYRHLFVRRLEPQPQLELTAFFAGELAQGTVLLNPPASQVEAKSNFALLSLAIHDEDLASRARLTPEEREAAQEAVPWTRTFVRGSVDGPDGEPVTSLVDFVAANPSDFVLKRAWGYGGGAVHVGTEVPPEAWARLCQETALDRTGGYVVQARVVTRRERHRVCTEAGVSEREWFVDYSAYASVNIETAADWSGVCRGAPSAVVNIAGGGGVVPVLRRSVAVALAQALEARANLSRTA
ncbi:MAG TPA: hypothetical protein VEY30_00520 [Myxococcaceae bacterium]|nr:hypothetical protein [Myxococcaceae bacterium]